MRRNKPLYITTAPNLPEIGVRAAVAACANLIQESGVTMELQLHEGWRARNWRTNGRLTPYMSVDWYLEEAARTSDREDQLNVMTIVRHFEREPWRRERDHYDLLIVDSDLYSGEARNNFVLGVTLPEIGCVVSLNRLLDSRLLRDSQEELIISTVMHELGHLFGLPSPNRQTQVEECLGPHCTNRCMMRQGLDVQEWIDHTKDRLTHGAFCSTCKRELKQFFGT